MDIDTFSFSMAEGHRNRSDQAARTALADKQFEGQRHLDFLDLAAVIIRRNDSLESKVLDYIGIQVGGQTICRIQHNLLQPITRKVISFIYRYEPFQY